MGDRPAGLDVGIWGRWLRDNAVDNRVLDNTDEYTIAGLTNTGYLQVDGTSIFVDSVRMDSKTDITGNLTVLGDGTFQGPLEISTINGPLSINDDATVAGNLKVDGTVSIGGSTISIDSITIGSSGPLYINASDMTISTPLVIDSLTRIDQLVVIGDTTVTGNLKVDGTPFMSGDSTIMGNSSISGDLFVDGTAYIGGSTVVIDGTGVSASTGSFSGNVTLSGLSASSIVETTDGKVLTSASKRTAYNKNFGSSSGSVCQGNDSRLSDARTPTAHTLNSATYHTVSGLTTGHFLKATGATSFNFQAHGLTYTDVGAAPANHGVSTNYVPRSTGATSFGNSLIYDSGSRIGIMTTSPNSELHTHHDGHACYNRVTAYYSTNDATYNTAFGVESYQEPEVRISNYIGGGNTRTTFWVDDGSEVRKRLAIHANGRLAADINTPLYDLHLGPYLLGWSGSAVTSTLQDKSTAIGLTSSNGSATYLSTISISNSGLFEMGTPGSYPVSLFTNNTSRIYIKSTGEVGIGTTDSGTKLDVLENQDGTAVITSTIRNFNNTASNRNMLKVGQRISSTYHDAVIMAESGRVFFGYDDPYSGNGAYAAFSSDPSNSIRLQGDTTVSSFLNTFDIRTAGSIGIGTTYFSPSVKLDIRENQDSDNAITAVFDNLNTAAGNRNSIIVRQRGAVFGELRDLYLMMDASTYNSERALIGYSNPFSGGGAYISLGSAANGYPIVLQGDCTTGRIHCTSIDTGHGFNELWHMDQDVLTTSDVRFKHVGIRTSATGANDIHIYDSGGSAIIALEQSSGGTGYIIKSSSSTIFDFYAPGTMSPRLVNDAGNCGIDSAGNFFATSSKGFVIDHPLLQGKKLKHVCTESPKPGIEYWGRSQLVNGEKEIQMPDWFDPLTTGSDYVVGITPIGSSAVMYVVKNEDDSIVKTGKFKVRTDSSSYLDAEFSWILKAERAGAAFDVEVDASFYG